MSGICRTVNPFSDLYVKRNCENETKNLVIFHIYFIMDYGLY